MKKDTRPFITVDDESVLIEVALQLGYKVEQIWWSKRWANIALFVALTDVYESKFPVRLTIGERQYMYQHTEYGNRGYYKRCN